METNLLSPSTALVEFLFHCRISGLHLNFLLCLECCQSTIRGSVTEKWSQPQSWWFLDINKKTHTEDALQIQNCEFCGANEKLPTNFDKQEQISFFVLRFSLMSCFCFSYNFTFARYVSSIEGKIHWWKPKSITWRIWFPGKMIFFSRVVHPKRIPLPDQEVPSVWDFEIGKGS